MPSQLDVINYALTEIGRLPVTNAADTQGSQLMLTKVDSLLRKYLRLTDWNFAIKYVSDNTPVVSPFSPEYLYSYQLPADFGRFDRTGKNLSATFGLYYRLLDNYILTNSRPFTYYYVVRQCPYADLDDTSFIAMGLYLASESAMALTNDKLLVGYLKNSYGKALADAMRFNDMERYIQSTPYNDFYRQAYI